MIKSFNMYQFEIGLGKWRKGKNGREFEKRTLEFDIPHPFSKFVHNHLGIKS